MNEVKRWGLQSKSRWGVRSLTEEKTTKRGREGEREKTHSRLFWAPPHQ